MSLVVTEETLGAKPSGAALARLRQLEDEAMVALSRAVRLTARLLQPRCVLLQLSPRRLRWTVEQPEAVAVEHPFEAVEAERLGRVLRAEALVRCEGRDGGPPLLGVPLQAGDGTVVGALVVCGAEAHRWSEADVAGLKDIADGVTSEAVLREELALLLAADASLHGSHERLAQVMADSERRFRQIAECLPQLVWTCRPDGWCDYLSPQWVAYTGISEEEQLGYGWAERVVEEDRGHATQAWQRSVRTEEPLEVEFRIRGRDGSARWFHTRAVPLRDESGRVLKWFGTNTDVHALKEAELRLRESEERLQMALSAAAMGVWARNYKRGDAYWSPELCRLFGVDDFDGQPGRIAELVTPEAAEMIADRVAEAEETGGLFEAEFQVYRKDGRVLWVASRGRASYDAEGRLDRLVGVTMDVTARRLAEEESARAKAAAESANRAKDEFLAALSHELRTPLNPVLLLASEMERSGTLSPSLREDFALIRKNVELEARLIDDLLDLTAIMQKKLQLKREAVDLHEIVREAVEMVRSEAGGRPMHVDVQLGAPSSVLMADGVRLRQIVWNVLRNAFKFTPANGCIAITTSCPRVGWVRLTVADSGHGMTPDELACIFDAFSQGRHAQTQAFGGLGLGLAIARRLMEWHGGAIRGFSEGRHRGATFELDFPLGTPPSVEAAPAPGSGRGESRLEGLRLLLVEDNDSTRDTLTRLLRRRGHRVTAAASVAQALEELAGAEFDVLISDLGLADGTGHELMAHVRRQSALPGIALSGYGMERDVQGSERAGFAIHLTKPVTMTVLEDAIASVIRRAAD